MHAWQAMANVFRNISNQFGLFVSLLGGTLPFGQLPVMEVDGKMMSQSLSMFKFVARETGTVC